MFRGPIALPKMECLLTFGLRQIECEPPCRQAPPIGAERPGLHLQPTAQASAPDRSAHQGQHSLESGGWQTCVLQRPYTALR